MGSAFLASVPDLRRRISLHGTSVLSDAELLAVPNASNDLEGLRTNAELIRDAGFRSRFDVSVVGIYRRDGYRVTNLAFVPLRAGERILVQGETEAIQGLEKFSDFTSVDVLGADELSRHYAADERLFVVRLPKDSELVDVTLEKSRLADAFDFRVVAIFRDGKLRVMDLAEIAAARFA